MPKCISPLYLARYASLAGLRGKPIEALHLWAAAETLMTAYASYMDASDRYLYEKTIAPAVRALDDASFQAALAEGRSMSLEQAIDYARKSVGSSV